MKQEQIINELEEEFPEALTKEIYDNPYLKNFTDKMMLLSNRLNEIGYNDTIDDVLDIKEDFLPFIRDFIYRMNGL